LPPLEGNAAVDAFLGYLQTFIRKPGEPRVMCHGLARPYYGIVHRDGADVATVALLVFCDHILVKVATVGGA
jgi:hypothetical protein